MIKEDDTGIIILDEDNDVPIDLQKLIQHVNINTKIHKQDYILGICRAACKIFEARTEKAIIRKRIRLSAERIDPIFSMAPFIKVEKIKIKDGRRWINLSDESDYSIRYLNRDRKAQLIIEKEEIAAKYRFNHFDITDQNKDPNIVVEYIAGYSLEKSNLGESVGFAKETPLKLPESIEYCILAICSSLYDSENNLKLSKEIFSMYETSDSKEQVKKDSKGTMSIRDNRSDNDLDNYTSRDKENIIDRFWIG